MSLDLLRKVGLSDGEITVYNVLLELGNSPVNRIHEHTGIERRNIYDILNKLIERGLVTYIRENKRRYFRVTHPDNIIEYVEAQENDLGRLKKDLNKELPEWVQKFDITKPSVDAQLFRGPEGMKASWNDMLNAPEILWLGSGGYIPRSMPDFFRIWNRKRIEGKVKIRHLYRDDFKHKVIPQGKFCTVKILPKSFNGSPAAFCIWGDKVGNFMLGDQMFAFVFESKELADNYRTYFEHLWQTVKPKRITKDRDYART